MNKRRTWSVTELRHQLQQTLEHITDEQYGRRVPLLSNASIGQHTRHIIELFLELEIGYENGLVNYDARKRDEEIETRRSCAIDRLSAIASRIDREGKSLTLVADLGSDGGTACRIPTNYHRELLYKQLSSLNLKYE